MYLLVIGNTLMYVPLMFKFTSFGRGHVHLKTPVIPPTVNCGELVLSLTDKEPRKKSPKIVPPRRGGCFSEETEQRTYGNTTFSSEYRVRRPIDSESINTNQSPWSGVDTVNRNHTYSDVVSSHSHGDECVNINHDRISVVSSRYETTQEIYKNSNRIVQLTSNDDMNSTLLYGKYAKWGIEKYYHKVVNTLDLHPGDIRLINIYEDDQVDLSFADIYCNTSLETLLKNHINGDDKDKLLLKFFDGNYQLYETKELQPILTTMYDGYLN